MTRGRPPKHLSRTGPHGDRGGARPSVRGGGGRGAGIGRPVLQSSSLGMQASPQPQHIGLPPTPIALPPAPNPNAVHHRPPLPQSFGNDLDDFGDDDDVDELLEAPPESKENADGQDEGGEVGGGGGGEKQAAPQIMTGFPRLPGTTAPGQLQPVGMGMGEGPGRRPADDDDDDDDLDEDIVFQTQNSETAEALRLEVSLLLDKFTPEQTRRYEVYRRANLPKAAIKRYVQSMLGTVPPAVAIVVAGAGKLFVGELTEKALEVKEEWGHQGALRPEHIREAYRRFRQDSHAHAPTYKRTFLS
ncbi:hTAFII28-like protein conserved region-domain-containing protein [Cladochytrium replicatum]|nr:hTAFII28-like protein conserved region-domain-containing protein [Cladochytrium replicatum]